MDYDDARELFDYWADWPPVHEAVRRIGQGLGIERAVPAPAMDDARSADDPSGIGALITAQPASVSRG